MAAQSISFFFRHVLKKAYVIPSVIYPGPTGKLPPVMSVEEMKSVIDTVQNLKHRTIIILLYSTGMRVSEVSKLKITDIDSKAMRIKVVQGKGAKGRFTILSQQVLLELRTYYIFYKPQEYLFNGYQPGKRMSIGLSVSMSRSKQWPLNIKITRMGIKKNKWYSASANLPVALRSIYYPKDSPK